MTDRCCGSDILAALERDEAASVAVRSIHAGRHFEVDVADWPTVRPVIEAAIAGWAAAGKTFLADTGRVALQKHDDAYASRGARTTGPVTPAKGPGMIGAP